MSFGLINMVVIGNLCESYVSKMILKTKLEWPENEWEERKWKPRDLVVKRRRS